MQPPEFLKCGDTLIPTKDIINLDISDIERQSVTVTFKQDDQQITLNAKGFDAIDAIMALRPSALEGRRFKWKKGGWAIHNLIGHPVMEILARLHFYNAAMHVHDTTVPAPRDFHPKIAYAKSGFGASLTSNVLSSFDQEILDHVHADSVVYDIGAGEGALSLACAEKGAKVHAIDLSSPPSNLPDNITWHQQDLREINTAAPQWEQADILIFRRVLYYFPYIQALNILKNFKPLLKNDGHSFCSLIAMHSPYAQTGYTNKPIHERFEKAVNQPAVDYNLLQPVCMYTKTEAAELFKAANYPNQILNHSNWSVYVHAGP